MPGRLTFDPNNQGDIAAAAAQIMSGIESSLPKVPWFSNSGQEAAFKQIVSLVTAQVASLDADGDSKDAVTFWALSLLYANNKGVRLATASAKNWGAYGVASIVQAFIDWAGTNTHPGQAVATEIMGRQMKQMMADGIPEKIYNKTLEIADKNNITPEAASTLFQEWMAEASARYQKAGLSEHEADRKALDDVLNL